MKLLHNHWYPILESREVKAHKPLGVERLGLKLVLWRNPQGRLICQLDRCPHLGAALSKGSVCENHLVCPFHGFEFDAAGECRHIPANGRQGRIPAGMAVQTYTVREAHGFIWFWSGEARERYPAIPFFDELAGWPYATTIADWPTHYTRAIENQLDVAHLAFVHKTTIGAGGRCFVDGPYVETPVDPSLETPAEIKVWVTNFRDEGQSHRSQKELGELSVGTEPSLHFKFPGLWKLNIASKIQNFIAFVPINERETRYYLRVYHKTHNRLAGRLFTRLMSLSNGFILNQDKRVVVTQLPLDSSDAHDDRLIGADRAISQFRKLYAHLLEGEELLPMAPETRSGSSLS